MNQFFQTRRFSLLVAQHWGENRKRYLLSVLAYTGMLIAWFAFGMLVESDEPTGHDVQHATYFLSLFLGGAVYAGQYFRELRASPGGTGFLMLPASQFEKLLCGLLFTALLFFIVVTAAFYAADALMVFVSNAVRGSEGRRMVLNVFTVNFFRFNDRVTLSFLPCFFLAQAAIVLGSVYFRKHAFFKTIICGLATWAFLAFLMYLAYRQLLPRGNPSVPLPDAFGQTVGAVIYALPPFLWIATYYRLKATQI
jgi:hypothetical protein